MSIEQTNQLILLVLNSVLMALLSSFLLGGAWLRQSALLQQLRHTKAHYQRLTRRQEGVGTALVSQEPPAGRATSKGADAAQLKQVREQRQRLNSQYQWSRFGMLSLHMALLLFSVSLLALAMRSLLAFNSLIPAALFLFALGAAGLLVGIGCILIDFAQGNHSNDSLGQTLGNIIQQISRQWSRHSRRLNTRSAVRSVSPNSSPIEP